MVALLEMRGSFRDFAQVHTGGLGAGEQLGGRTCKRMTGRVGDGGHGGGPVWRGTAACDERAVQGFTFAKITGDPAGDVRAQTDEVTPFQILRKAAIPAQPAATNDFIKRRESVAGALSRLIDGALGLIVHPQCAVLRKAMAGGYALKRVQVGGAAKYRDMPDKNDYSHVAESLQYLLVGGGDARLLVKRENRGPRPELAVME